MSTTPRALTPDQEQELAARYRRGSTCLDLAEHFKIAESTVQLYLLRLGITRRRRGNPYGSSRETGNRYDIDDQWLIDQLQAGRSRRAIARDVGCTHGAINFRVRRLREKGVEI